MISFGAISHFSFLLINRRFLVPVHRVITWTGIGIVRRMAYCRNLRNLTRQHLSPQMVVLIHCARVAVYAISAAILLGTLCLISIGCVDGGVMLQDSQQGEWSNFHNLAAKGKQARTFALNGRRAQIPG